LDDFIQDRESLAQLETEFGEDAQNVLLKRAFEALRTGRMHLAYELFEKAKIQPTKKQKLGNAFLGKLILGQNIECCFSNYKLYQLYLFFSPMTKINYNG